MAGRKATERRPARPIRTLLSRVSLAGLLAAAPLASAGDARVQAVLPRGELPPESRLSVGIALFDPGLPESAEEREALEREGTFAEVRKSEARFVSCHLKETLEATGQWGVVRVLPSIGAGADVVVSGKILASDGRVFSLAVRAVDSRGRAWKDGKYRQVADASVFDDEAIEQRDPYQELYNRIANDLVAVRDKLDVEELVAIREVSRLRFAASLAPALYGDYLSENGKNRIEIERLPAEGDPMLARIERIRERDHLFVDTLNGHYDEFYLRMHEPYTKWREFSLEERIHLRALRREALMMKILGGVFLATAIGVDSDSTVGRVGRTAAGIGGMSAIGEGFQRGGEARIHLAALEELAASFDGEVEPLLIEVEGQTLRLEGSAETQYEEWRRLLAEIFRAETGLGLEPEPAAAAPGAAGD
jgi:hypothetical protein